MAEHVRADLCLAAPDMSAWSRAVTPDLVRHSGRGSRYPGSDYARVQQGHGVRVGMSRAGDCYDDAMVSSRGSLNTERVCPRNYETLGQAEQSFFKYIECRHDRRRRHSAIGYVSPEQFEASRN